MMKPRETGIVPERMDVFPSGEIGILWADGHESVYAAFALRCACPCAACVDEDTGRRILDPAAVSRDVVARMHQGVGNYGVQFVWSDGHATGIYAHQRLRSMCPCPQCRGSQGGGSLRTNEV